MQVSYTHRALGEAHRGEGPGVRVQDGQQEVPELPEEQAVQRGLEDVLPARDLPRLRDTGAGGLGKKWGAGGPSSDLLPTHSLPAGAKSSSGWLGSSVSRDQLKARFTLPPPPLMAFD